MLVSIASGKGGTGKTTVSVSLAIAAENITLVDADVEEPNANILLRADRSTAKKVSLPFPVFDMNKCDFCEKCSDFCAFNAIVVLKDNKVFAVPEICKSCGACKLVCPQDAISEEPRDIGYIRFGERMNVNFIEGEMNIGQAHPPPLIHELFKYIPGGEVIGNRSSVIGSHAPNGGGRGTDYRSPITDYGVLSGGDVIVDCPPGAAHPMVESVRQADFVILVTEPTPFGLHDVKEALTITESLKKRVGLVINRADIGTDELAKFAVEREIPILMEIPYSDEIASFYSMGRSPAEFSPQWRDKFAQLWMKIKSMISPA